MRYFFDIVTWELRKLGEVSDIVRGSSPRPISDSKWFDTNSKVGWLRISDVTSQQGRIKKLDQHLSKLGEEKTRVLLSPHLLLSIAASVGYPVINYVPTGVHDGFLIFKNPKFQLNYGFYWLQNNKNKWQKYGQPGSQVNLNSSIVENAKIFLPNNNEQSKIIALLLRIDKMLALQQRKLEYYRKLKKRLSNKVFSTENYGATVTLGKIFNTVTDYVANGSFKSLRENVKTYSNKNYAYLIRLQDASNNWQGPWLYTDKKGYDFLKKSKLRPGDIIMANVGSVGKVFQVPDLSYPMTLAPNAILLRSKAANNAFLFEFLRSDYGQNLVRKMTTPGVQNKINKTDFKKITIRLPKKEIQDKWASLFESLNQIELGQLSSISNLKEIKKFLLQNMFI